MLVSHPGVDRPLWLVSRETVITLIGDRQTDRAWLARARCILCRPEAGGESISVCGTGSGG